MNYEAIFITSGIYPLNNGGALGTFSIYKRISKVLRVKMFSLIDDAFITKAVDEFSDKSINLYSNKSSHSLDYYIKRLKNSRSVNVQMLEEIKKELKKGNCRFIFFDFSAREYFFIVRNLFPTIKTIYLSYNAEFLNIMAMLKENEKYGNKIFYNFCMNRLRAYFCQKGEMRCCKDADEIFSVSIQDIHELSRKYHIKKEKFTFCKPLIEFTRVKCTTDIKRFTKKILIVGSMRWPFNVEGVLWFVEKVFTKLIVRDPEYKLYIVGRDPSKEIIALEKKYSENVIVTGTVKDIDKFYKICDLCVIPVFSGTGVKIKLLEALGKGIPVISHSFSAEGYRNVEQVIEIADSAADYISKISELENAVSRRLAMYYKICAYYENYMSDDNVIQNKLRLLKET